MSVDRLCLISCCSPSIPVILCHFCTHCFYARCSVLYIPLHSFAAGKLAPYSMFRNPTAAVNLFHVGKQYLAFCRAKAAVTRNLIGRKIISSVERSDTRNSLPILDVIRSSHKRHHASEYCTAVNERYVKRQVFVIRARSAISLSDGIWTRGGSGQSGT